MKKRAVLFLLMLTALAPGLMAKKWEWRLFAGPWTLQPLNTPVERLAEKVVAEEVQELLSPLLGEFSFSGFQPEVDMRSRGWSFGASIFRSFAGGRFAIGLTGNYLRLTLPFSLADERRIFYQGIPLAVVRTSGEGEIELRTFMASLQGRWRFFQSGPLAAHAALGAALLRFRGHLQLPLFARIDSIFGSAELEHTEELTLDELRRQNAGIPAWSLSPSLGLSCECRLRGKSRLFIEVGVSQGTFLALGIAWGR